MAAQTVGRTRIAIRRRAFREAARAIRVAAVALALASHARADEVLRMSGTGTALGMLQRVGAAFAAANAGVRVQVLPNLGSSGAIDAVAQGALDVAISGRPLREVERQRGLASFEIARTPFVFAAGPGAGVGAISSADVVRIYRGELSSWPNGSRIRLVLRPHTDADTILLRSFSPELAEAVDAALVRPGMLMAVTNQDCDELLERTPGALGGTTLMQLRAEGRTIAPLAWNGREPTVANMVAGTYPLAKPLHAVVRTVPRPLVRRWLRFLASPKGRGILESLGAAATPFTLD